LWWKKITQAENTQDKDNFSFNSLVTGSQHINENMKKEETFVGHARIPCYVAAQILSFFFLFSLSLSLSLSLFSSSHVASFY
jgi:hypothetical protein